jgi:hypothetical protein
MTEVETVALLNLNSASDIVVFACMILEASLPTVYLNCGLLDVTACSITFATSCGDDAAFSNID